MVTSSLDIIMKKDFLYKFAEKIYNRSLKNGRVRIFCSSKVRQNIAALYPGEEGMKVKQHIIQKIRMCLLVFLAGALLAFAVYLGDRTSTVLNENRIERTDYGEKSQEIPVTVTLGEEQQDMILQVEERQYTEDELENMLSSLLQTLESQIKGENIDLEHVKTNLNLLTTFGGYPFEVTWECQNYGLIDSDGTVKNENLPQEGEVTGINGVFTYKDFRAEHLFYIHILPPDLTEEESVFERLQEAIAEANDKTKYDTEIDFDLSLARNQSNENHMGGEKKQQLVCFAYSFGDCDYFDFLRTGSGSYQTNGKSGQSNETGLFRIG